MQDYEAQQQISWHLGAVAEELSLLHGSMGVLQETLLGVVAGAGGDAGRYSEFQDIDRMTQTVEQLAAFLAAMAATASRCCTADLSAALAHVSLGGLQTRLGGRAAPEQEADRGSIDLF